MTKAKEGEFVPGYALHEFPFFIWYTYPQLLLKNAAPRPGSFFDRHGGSVLRRHQQTEHITEKDRYQGLQCSQIGAMRHMQLQHHDGDDDRDDAIAECFQSAFTHYLPVSY